VIANFYFFTSGQLVRGEKLCVLAGRYGITLTAEQMKWYAFIFNTMPDVQRMEILSTILFLCL